MLADPLSAETYVNAIVLFASEQGVDLSESVPLFPEGALYDGQLPAYVPFVRLCLLLDSARTQLKSTDFGVLLGSRLGVSSHGNVGFALSNCRDLQQALELITRYHQTRFQFVLLNGNTVAGTYRLEVIPTCDWGKLERTLFEVVVFGLMNVIGGILGGAANQCRINFPYCEPDWFASYSESIDCTFSFAHERCVIHIPVSLLSTRLISFDAHSLSIATRQCDSDLNLITGTESVSAKITRILESRDEWLPIDVIAKRLNISTSTLIRKLKAENKSYKGIVQERKKQMALTLLRSKQKSIEEISYKVGFKDVSNFGRFFRQHFDCTPAAWRKKNAL